MASAEDVVLIIDDDAEIRYSLERVLSRKGHPVEAAPSGEVGVRMAEELQPAVVFLDNRMEGMSGIETLQHLRSSSPRAMVILMTAFGTTQTAIEAMKFGAFDYIVKPFDVAKVLTLTENALKAHRELRAAKQEQPGQLLSAEDYAEGMVGSSEQMQAIFKTIGQVAPSPFTVLITGESGTGKELVARCIHRHSHVAGERFQAVNCAAIPENLIESELFGHEKGSFTGATQQRRGVFEQCDGGTIFLDEIGDMALPTQTKILRALQEGEIQRVGGSEVIKVQVRLIAATNRDLENMVAEKEFREDLYYRLNVVRIRMPGLRERTEDIPALVDFMLQRMGKERRTKVRYVAPEVLRALGAYAWPGNVRELENVLQRSTLSAKGETILLKDLPGEIRAAAGERAPDASEGATSEVEGALEVAQLERPEAEAESEALPLRGPTLEEAYDLLYRRLREQGDEAILHLIEREMIVRVLKETGGNQVKASALLGMTRATLRKRIDQLELRI